MDSHDHQMFVRSSKFRHVFGSVAKKEHCYEGIRVTRSAHDGNFCAVNPKFLAVVVESAGGGAFVVLPLEKTGRIDVNVPKVCGHRGPVTEIKWNPFDDNVIASASEDAMIKIWQIPDDGLTENLNDWSVELVGHSKKVCYIEWHPTAENILLSAGADHQCIVWNVETQSVVSEISDVHRDTIYSISWNHDGSTFATTCKDRMIRIIDARSGAVITEGEGHMGTKASKIVFLGRNNRLFSTGFSKHSERQYAVWDAGNLSKALYMEDIDSSSGLLIPFYDHDTNMIYLAGKGDGNVRYFEVVDNAPYVYFLSQFQSSLPQRGLGMMPKRGVDTSKCEIARFYKLHTQKEICEPLSMIVPRKSEMFQPDIYPPTASMQAALTADQWLSGLNREPLLMSLKDGQLCPSSEPTRSTNVTNSRTNVTSSYAKHDQSDMLSWKQPTTTASARSQLVKADLVPVTVNSNKELSSNNNEVVDPKTRTDQADIGSVYGASSLSASSAKNKSDSRRDIESQEMMRQRDRIPSNRVDSSVQATRPYLRVDTSSVPSVLSSTVTLALNTPTSVDSVATYSIAETNSIQSPLTRITVKRTSSMTAGNSVYSTTEQQHTPHLSRNISDVSDISTTTPITPTPKAPPRRTRTRQQDDDISSCSSTEAVNQIDDGWCDNPLYAQQQLRRRHKYPSSSPAKHQLGGAGTASSRLQPTPVDVGPLDDVLVQTRNDRHQQFSRSNVELNRVVVATANATNPDVSTTTAGSSPTLPTQASMFRSEPDIPGLRLTRGITDDVIVLDAGGAVAVGSMIDCISVEAPDDTLIKPSRLRASMRQRRTPTGSSSDDTSVASSRGGGAISRFGSLRDAPPLAGTVSIPPADTSSPFQRHGWKAASLREGKRTPAAAVVAHGGLVKPSTEVGSSLAVDPLQTKMAVPSLSSSRSPTDVFGPHQNVILQGSSASKSSVAAGTGAAAQLNTTATTSSFVFTAPADLARRRAAASQVTEVLPTFQRLSTQVSDKSKRDGSNGGTTLPSSAATVVDSNAGVAVAYDKLFREFQELQEKYIQQLEDMQNLKEQVVRKDVIIHQLENQLRLAQGISSNGYAV